jgi:hypothetical protein
MGLVRAGLSLALGLGGAARTALQAHALYSLGLLAASRAFGRDAPARLPREEDSPHIAMLVVAHDEASVIGACVESLLAQRYPTDRFEVFVVADHCTDGTAAIARERGAVVFERGDDGSGEATGKPAAVAFAVERILSQGGFDAIALFDADNVVDPDFLSVVAGRLAAGERVVQGFVDAKNPDASWVSAASAIGFWAIDGIVQRPRERLGLSASLMGTGFAASSALFRDTLAPKGALTDDLEANARLALLGVRIAYEPNARTLDEKPTRLDTATRQRQRWMQGRWATAERWLPALAAKVIAPAPDVTLADRFRTIDVAAQLVSPSLLFTATTLGALSAGEVALRTLTGVGSSAAARRALRAAALYFLVPVPAIARHRPGAAVWRAYLMQPVYLAKSVPLAVRGWAARRETTWERTEKG